MPAERIGMLMRARLFDKSVGYRRRDRLPVCPGVLDSAGDIEAVDGLRLFRLAEGMNDEALEAASHASAQ